MGTRRTNPAPTAIPMVATASTTSTTALLRAPPHEAAVIGLDHPTEPARCGRATAMTTATTTATVANGCALPPLEVATTANPPSSPRTRVTAARRSWARGTSTTPTMAPRTAPRLWVATSPAMHRHTMSWVTWARCSRPSPANSAIANRAPAAFEYVSVVDNRHRFWAGMASGYHRAVVATRPAAAETAPTPTTSWVARIRYLAPSRRVARNAQPKPIMLAPRGRKAPGRDWAMARMNHHRASALTDTTTATDRRSGRVSNSPTPTTSETPRTRPASAG